MPDLPQAYVELRNRTLIHLAQIRKTQKKHPEYTVALLAGKQAAKAAAEKIQAKLALGDTALLDESRNKARTFTEFAEGWLKHVAAQRKPGTSEKYEMILRKHWFPALGRLPLTAVTRDHIKAVLGEKLSADFKPKTVRGHLVQIGGKSVKVYYRQG